MTRELSGLIFNFREISDKEDRAYENYLLVERHIARLAVYYLDNTKGPLSEKKMASLLNLLEKDGIYVLDSNGNILLSCGRPADKDAFSGDALSHLLDISEDRPFSDIISSDDTPVEKRKMPVIILLRPMKQEPDFFRMKFTD